MRLMLAAAIVGTALSHAHGQGSPVTPRTPVYYDFQVDSSIRSLPGSVAPVYPPTLKAAGVSGEVLVSFVVDTAGRVELSSFKVIKSTDELFTLAVRAAMSEMRFRPALVGGRPVRQLAQLPFVFSVKE